MQAIILAAGMGNRLGKYTAHNTKCMLSINGRTLIERALDAIDVAGIRRCVLVVGYQKDNLIAFLGNRYKNIEITYISNDIYDKTNNIYSLYLAKDFLAGDDTLLLESDLIFEENLIAGMLTCPEPVLAAVAPYEAWMDGTVVQLTENRGIANFIPKKLFNYHEKETYYKTVNIYKFSKDFSEKIYLPFLEAYTQVMGNNEYYEQVLRVIASLDKHDLKAFVLSGQKWYEIDDVQDKNIAETIFASSSLEGLTRIQKCYGGYWRFPKMIDFCYLVNPYFPTPQMYHELKAYFQDLLSQYPSGLNTENLLAAKLFNIEADCVLTGNGAAELICALSRVIEGIIGVVYPTFNEYTERFGNNTIVSFTPDNFHYTKDDLIRFSAQCNCLVLINPDNPSGNYICKNDVLFLVEYFNRNNKIIILDESFIDFCDAEENKSVLTQDTLNRYPNVIVIRSLSKSYGIPGIRLGVLASGNRNLIKQVRNNIPIWNINSFGEYFLQIIGKYQKDYLVSCTKIIEERRRFKEELEKTGLLTVYPSQGNYFLCKINADISASNLAERILSEYGMFIKDLSGKKGIPDGSFVRIAIRARKDNEGLVQALAAMGKDLDNRRTPPPHPLKRQGILLLPVVVFLKRGRHE
ncbi:MAG: aminotransferase class I/II-fold pyridoxal phosphate-dependent enzyme [Treponema sp.]|jgi:histidinol-phosphate/aromatic aminotransferase/cobyric acid decarboxylase-like protein/choline kinase|nr:aminotransferase class I/II-fold pyridoxal phosphate-dependent enzyme [Treponema sp.]